MTQKRITRCASRYVFAHHSVSSYRKLKKLFEQHPDVHYALRHHQAGDYVVYKHHRCVVESSSKDILQLYEIDTGEHFSNVSPSEVFDPLFTDRYSALPALALRAKLEWHDGKPLSCTVVSPSASYIRLTVV